MAEHRGGSGNFAEDREKASEAGRKGGQHSGGNFKNDPERASEAGKKGGKNSHGGVETKPVGQMVRRFLHIQGLFLYNDIHYPRCGGTKR